ncbi:MAG TPA: hypothetical protein VFV71_01910 [Burkholderiales bacterium]|nr:hypothetical protein [Burkholderiales bacterium]
MTPRLPALILGLLPIVPALAQDAVPIEQEPRHRLVFQNEHIRYFDVELEPGYRSLYHWHRNDGVFVNIASSPTVAQDLGKEPVSRPGRAVGETYFIGYGTKPKAHRVANAGTTPYHVADAEILRGCGGLPGGDAAGREVLVDNERAVVTRVMLQPGESTELGAPCGVLVAVSAGSVSTESAAGESRADLAPAGYLWRQQDTPVKLTNAGSGVFHAIDVRLK